jgi:hypothetical protein
MVETSASSFGKMVPGSIGGKNINPSSRVSIGLVKKNKTVIMKIISLGLGVQSTALYYMSSTGELPRCDYAIFADPGKEKKGTIEYLKFLQNWQKQNNGVPILVSRSKNLYRDLLQSTNSTGQRFSSVPAFTKNEDGSIGMLRRQCTQEYKISIVDAAIRSILDTKVILKKKVEVWQGISLDELDRMSIPKRDWKIHIYPFCGYRVTSKDTSKLEFPLIKTRNDLTNWYSINGLPLPPKSSCVFCPYQSDAAWFDMKINQPSDFKAAVKVDKAIRNSTAKGIKNQVFLHDSCRPLDQIIFKAGQPDLWHGECSGNCHT